MREQIILTCSECSQKNYITRKNKKKTVDRIEIKKYCKHCRRHVVHKEGKLK